MTPKGYAEGVNQDSSGGKVHTELTSDVIQYPCGRAPYVRPGGGNVVGSEFRADLGSTRRHFECSVDTGMKEVL